MTIGRPFRSAIDASTDGVKAPGWALAAMSAVGRTVAIASRRSATGA